MDGNLLPIQILDFRIWAVLALVIGVLALYVTERLPMEITSIGAICLLMALFHFFPVEDGSGSNKLGVDRLLAGFANPALMTVLGLLVVGQALVRTGVLELGAQMLLRLAGGSAWLSVALAMVAVSLISGVMNNVPVVVIFIPILQSIAERMKIKPGKIMMGLSFTAALGGSMTLIGSASNLLVSGELVALGEQPLGFFEFAVPGGLLALVGLIYVVTVMPRLLADRGSLADRIMAHSHKYFLAQIPVISGGRLDGGEAVGAVLKDLPQVRLRMVIRDDQVFRPPYHSLRLKAGDLVVVAGSRKALTEVQGKEPGLLRPPGFHDHEPPESIEEVLHDADRALAEIMIPPGSSLLRRRVGRAGFQVRSRCAVLGIRRRDVVFRSRLSEIPMEVGDVLLIQGRAEDVERLRDDPDVVLMSGSRERLPNKAGARRALLVFLAVIVAASTGIVPVAVAALSGAAAVTILEVLSLQQASRSLDARIITVIPATLALGVALQETGAATLVAHGLIDLVRGAGPVAVLSGFFIVMALLSNIIGSNASAVLFTPIAIGLAREMGGDVHLYAIAVVMAANCAFATPTGYQTSLLVMGPGHYKYIDFPRAGGPLILLLWLTFTGYVAIVTG
ncbi:SLC13 family permease [Magnetospira thiophila]